jgi:hypothetical protein
MAQMNKKLARIYFNVEHPAGFSSQAKLAKAAGVSLKQTREWLSAQDAYTQHKPIIRKFKRNRYIVSNIRVCYEADLACLPNLSKENDSYAYILCVIDIFSRKAWGEALYNKKAATVAAAFERIFLRAPPPLRIRHDKGLEFRGPEVKQLLNKLNVQQIMTENPETKCAVVERFIRTLKTRLQRYFTHHGRERYIDVLPEMFNSYNASINTAIGCAPNNVTSKNIKKVYNYLYSGHGRYAELKTTPDKIPKFKINDTVKISATKHILQKGYHPNFTYEIFKIKKIIKRNPVVYSLSDWEGQPISGVFYAEEIQKCVATENQLFRIEEIIKEKGRGQNKILYVKWLGYSARYNSWVRASDLKSYE